MHRLAVATFLDLAHLCCSKVVNSSGEKTFIKPIKEGGGRTAVLTKSLSVKTKGESDLVDLTDDIGEAVKDSRMRSGIVTVFVPGSTGALTTIEYEPGLIHDLPAALERIAPRNADYEHERRWHDGNGHSHVRASILGPSLTIPFTNAELTLGRWQQIVFVELDVRPRVRELVVQIVGE
ncbi:MAG: secondary thiamine-phosphate synthase enzyme YjbQ [Candidatus Bathyarchaeia archaeon]